MGLGVEWDPYDHFKPTVEQWNLTYQRLDFMRPGFIRVVEPAWDYFAGYDAAHNPRYRWDSTRVVQLRQILAYAQSRGIPVILGDWGNPLVGGDARVPGEFIEQLRDQYGFTSIRYYNLMNEPNYQANCDFGCWTGAVHALSSEFAQLGLTGAVKLIGPDNANSWDDTAAAQALDRTVGLDADNPIGGDSWVTQTLLATPAPIGAYDSHRYATIWGVEHGVYADQMRSRREQISNADSPSKPYFEGEVGLTARQVSPFTAGDFLPDQGTARSIAALIDPSATAAAGSFVDSQPHIREFVYGVWIGDMMVQAIDAGLAGASAWDLDDAMHVGGQYGSQNLKQWGFWNSLGGQDGYPASDLQPRPWYYSWSLLARSFPAGSEPLTAPSTGVAGLRVASARIPVPGGYALSFAVVNDSDSPRSLTLSMPAVNQPLTLARYDYYAGDRPVDSAGFPAPAHVLSNVNPARGVSIALPSRGLVVLSSIGYGTVTVDGATQSVVDDLDGLRMAYAHSSRLEIDHSTPPLFNDDSSRLAVRPKTKTSQYVIYRAGRIASFEIKAYFRTRPGIQVYGSPDGRTWRAIPGAATNPAPSVGGHGWYLTDIFPNRPIPAGTTQLKVTLRATGTEISQVVIERRSY
jgi:hypothetical protein